MWVSNLLISELRRLVEESEIIKLVSSRFPLLLYELPSLVFGAEASILIEHSIPSSLQLVSSQPLTIITFLSNREDDAKWPKKNIVGRQELEIRLGNEHISFEVSIDGEG